ncbi:MAG: ankyrin repeat domain-containing protein, partial [Gammaproteobacteria bacterium]
MLNVPITAMGGGIWKHGNSVIFYHETYQVVVRKSKFASTETAKKLKVNTMEYAREVLKKTSLDSAAIEEMITKVCANRDILEIEDLKKIPDFPQGKFEDQKITKLVEEEKRILEKEKKNYIVRVQEILARVESGEKFAERDLLIIALGLKDFSLSKGLSVFKGHEDLRDKILANKALLPLIMVTCGKVLIAGPSNDNIIDLLLESGIDINSVDEKGMTALHYAVQNFYNYRKEPLNLINKLLDCGTNLKAEDKERRTPLMLATEHSRKGTVIAGGKVLELLQQKLADAALAHSDTWSPELETALPQVAAAHETTTPYWDSIQKLTRSAPTVSSEAKKRGEFSPAPQQTTPTPS